MQQPTPVPHHSLRMALPQEIYEVVEQSKIDVFCRMTVQLEKSNELFSLTATY